MWDGWHALTSGREVQAFAIVDCLEVDVTWELTVGSNASHVLLEVEGVLTLCPGSLRLHNAPGTSASS